jgi:hypothetical protein
LLADYSVEGVERSDSAHGPGLDIHRVALPVQGDLMYFVDMLEVCYSDALRESRLEASEDYLQRQMWPDDHDATAIEGDDDDLAFVVVGIDRNQILLWIIWAMRA